MMIGVQFLLLAVLTFLVISDKKSYKRSAARGQEGS